MGGRGDYLIDLSELQFLVVDYSERHEDAASEVVWAMENGNCLTVILELRERKKKGFGFI